MKKFIALQSFKTNGNLLELSSYLNTVGLKTKTPLRDIKYEINPIIMGKDTVVAIEIYYENKIKNEEEKDITGW